MPTELAAKAKQNLIDFVKEIDSRLADYWDDEIGNRFGFNKRQQELVTRMLLHSKEHNLRPAKRLRGSFVYYGYLLGNKIIDDRLWQAAMGVEIVHTGILMHDDLMDQDNIRRGGPTTHKFFESGDWHYGESMAVCVGDALWEIGQEMLLSSGFDDRLIRMATQKMLRGVANTAWGQAFDVTLEKDEKWVEDDVITLHKAKTAIYTYENPLFIGAILAGLGDEVLGILHDYSMDGGVAFQLQDDVLGVYGDPEKTGKSANSDLLQGKVTLLVLKALELGSAEQVGYVKRVWGKRQAAEDDIAQAKKALTNSGALAYSMDISRKYAQKAVETAEKLRRLNLNDEAVDYIQGIAQYMVEREM